MSDAIKKGIEDARKRRQDFLDGMKTLQVLAAQATDTEEYPPFRRAYVFFDEVRLEVWRGGDLRRARAFLRRALGHWEDRIVKVEPWAYGVEVMYRGPRNIVIVMDYIELPAGILSDGCRIDTVPSSQRVVVCEAEQS